MTIEECINREIKTVSKYRIRAKKAKSERIIEERRKEAEYHEFIVGLLIELEGMRDERCNTAP